MGAVGKAIGVQRAMAFQWLPRRLVEAYQLRGLRQMVRLCERRVPLYRELFKQAGVTSRDLNATSDLRHFPILTREQVVAAYPDGILSRPPKTGDVVFRTSGTSGQFMHIAYDGAANDLLDAIYLRALFNAGYRPWHRFAYFWYEEHKAEKSYEKLGILKKTYMTVDPDPRVQLDALRALRPHYIYHFPSSLRMIARVIEEEGIGDFRPLGVVSQGEFLAKEVQEDLTRIFGCPVWNQYGAQEFNRLGWNCKEQRAFHLDADSVFLEVVDGNRPLAAGAEGDLVFTGLINPLMPLVRYRIGDVGRMVEGRCACRRGLPLFEVTEGRRDDVLLLPDGRRIGPRVLAPQIESLPGFSLYRVVQKQPDSIVVSIVKLPGAPPELESTIRQRLQTLMGAQVRIQVDSVAAIPLSKRGKLRKIVCEVRGTDEGHLTSTPAKPMS